MERYQREVIVDFIDLLCDFESGWVTDLDNIESEEEPICSCQQKAYYIDDNQASHMENVLNSKLNGRLLQIGLLSLQDSVWGGIGKKYGKIIQDFFNEHRWRWADYKKMDCGEILTYLNKHDKDITQKNVAQIDEQFYKIKNPYWQEFRDYNYGEYERSILEVVKFVRACDGDGLLYDHKCREVYFGSDKNYVFIDSLNKFLSQLRSFDGEIKPGARRLDRPLEVLAKLIKFDKALHKLIVLNRSVGYSNKSLVAQGVYNLQRLLDNLLARYDSSNNDVVKRTKVISTIQSLGRIVETRTEELTRKK